MLITNCLHQFYKTCFNLVITTTSPTNTKLESKDLLPGLEAET